MPYLGGSQASSPSASPPVNQKPDSIHFKDWPNEAGFHAPTQERPLRRLKVTGEFPACTAGRLFRTGPQARKVDGFDVHHWFDGFTVIHRFDLSHDKDASGAIVVDYAARCQVDALLEKARQTRSLDGVSFGQRRDPCDSYFKKVKSVFQAATSKAKGAETHNIGVALQRKPLSGGGVDALTVTTDNHSQADFDATTLEPLGVTDQEKLHPDLRGPLSCAHAAVDPVTGDIFNYNLAFGPRSTYRVFKTDASTGKTEILATFADKNVSAAYIHSIFLTHNFVILCIWPAYFKGVGLSVLWEQNLLDAMAFDGSAKCHWLVVDRRKGRGLVSRFTSPAMFAFHTTNAFEEQAGDGGAVDIVAEVVQYPNLDILKRFYYENLISTGKGVSKFAGRSDEDLNPTLVRYRLPGVPLESRSPPAPVTLAVHPATIVSSTPNAGELPTINPLFSTKPHRYVYGAADRGLSSFVDAICKTDTHTGEAIYWSVPKHSPGEPIFVPHDRADGVAGEAAEDDGVLLSVVLDGPRERSYLLCLDARDLTEIARAEVDAAVGIGFHGMFINDAPNV